MKLRRIIFYLLATYHMCYGGAMITISDPGHYSLGEDIIYTNFSSSQDIILITASNVVLDLNQHTIGQSHDATSGIIAIEISSGLSNITIQNGSINDVSNLGILVNSNCSNITISNVLTYSCIMGGISFSGSAGNEITDCTITNCTIESCAVTLNSGVPFYGINLVSCLRLNVNNCAIISNGNWSHPTVALGVSAVSNSVFDTISISRISGFPVQAVEVNNGSQYNWFNNITIETCASFNDMWGLAFDGTSNNLATNCIIKGNGTKNGTTNGAMFYSTGGNNVHTNCQAISNNANILIGGTSRGFFSAGSQNCYINCLAHGNISSGDVAIGFDTNSSGVSKNMYINCQATNNSTTANTTAAGFRLNTTTNCAVIGCTATSNNALTGASAQGNGFLESSGTTNVFANNYAARNNGSTAANSRGFVLGGSTTAYISNVSLRNGSTSANQFSGFGVSQASTQAITSVNSITQPWTNAGLV